MNGAQDLIDEIQATSGQRWLLAALSVLAAALGCTAIGAASGASATGVTVAVVVLAAASALRPDSPVGILVVIAVAWFWLARIDDVTTPWTLPVAAAVLVFHVTTALMAATSRRSTLDRALLGVWLRRSALVALATVATWLLVVVLHRRHAAGNAMLTLAALTAIVAATLVVRWRSTPRH